jgi:hypothetical protein
MAPTLLLVAGLIVCFAWWAAIERAISYQDRYVAFAKRLEERFLVHQKFLTDGAETPMIFPASLQTRNTMRIVIGVFGSLYAVAIGRLIVVYLCGSTSTVEYS